MTRNRENMQVPTSLVYLIKAVRRKNESFNHAADRVAEAIITTDEIATVLRTLKGRRALSK